MGIGGFLSDMSARVREALAPVQRRTSPNTFLGAPSPGWFGGETWPGSFQQGAGVVPSQSLLTSDAIYACLTLIAGDIAKLPLRLVEQTKDGIWLPTTSSAFSPVLRKPNRFQTRIQFIESWVCSLMGIHGNAYILKERDGRGVVTDLYVLDPARVTPLVAPDGQVFYKITADNLAGTGEATVPASEIIHDRVCPLFHPLVGISPLLAASPAARTALAIQSQSESYFAGGQRLQGILTVPGTINKAQAREIADGFRSTYKATGSDGLAVVGAGAAYNAISGTAAESQLVEQFRLTARSVCMAYHVPLHKIGAEPPPAYANGEQAQQSYYNEALQLRIESIEALLDEGLGIGEGVRIEGRILGVELDVRALSRMDGVQRSDRLSKLTGGGIMSPNEARQEEGLPPVDGGDNPFMQQQNWPVRDLANRPQPALAPAAAPEPPPADTLPADTTRDIAGLLLRAALQRMDSREVAMHTA